MKAVLLAAGWPGRDFPEHTKPKCLYHVGGRALLDLAVNAVQEAGVDDVRVVVGYKADEIEEYARQRNWNLEFVRNDDWKTDGVKSLEVGLDGVHDDVLIVCADLIIDAGIIKAFLATPPRRLAWIRSIVPWDQNHGHVAYDDIYRNDIDNSIVKIPQHLMGLFEGARERAETFIARYHWDTPTGPGTGVYFGAAITETFSHYRPIEEVVIPEPIRDVDAYRQTDEYRIARRMADIQKRARPHGSTTPSRPESPVANQRVEGTVRAFLATRHQMYLFEKNLRLLNDVLQSTPFAERFWMLGGLLLGWAREGRILAHDSQDADFGFFREDEGRWLEAVPALVRAGFEPLHRFVDNSGRAAEYTFSRDGAKFDFFEHERVGDRVRCTVFGGTLVEGKRAGVEMISEVPAFDLAPVDFLGRTWQKPTPHEIYLSAVYGRWLVPNPDYDYNTDDLSIVDRRPWTGSSGWDRVSVTDES